MSKYLHKHTSSQDSMEATTIAVNQAQQQQQQTFFLLSLCYTFFSPAGYARLLVIMKRKELPGLTLEKILLWTTWILNDDEMENEKSDFLLLKKNNIKWKAHKKANVREREKENSSAQQNKV